MACTDVIINKPVAFKVCAPKTCVECDQTVYPLEQIAVGQFVYHKWCFRCAQCNRILSLSSYAVAPAGIPYCKPHFISTMKLRGGFDDFAVARVMSSEDLAAVAHPVESGNIRWITSTAPRPIHPVNRKLSSSSAAVTTSSSSEDNDSTTTSVSHRCCRPVDGNVRAADVNESTRL